MLVKRGREEWGMSGLEGWGGWGGGGGGGGGGGWGGGGGGAAWTRETCPCKLEEAVHKFNYV